MKFLKKNLVQTKKVVIVFVLSILVIIGSYFSTQALIIQEETIHFKKEITELTKESVITSKNLLQGMEKDLAHTAAKIEKFDNVWATEVKRILRFSHDMNLFDVTFIADVNGRAYSNAGVEFSVADQDYFKKAMKSPKGEVVFSEVLPSKKFEAIQIIAYPIYSKSNTINGVLFGLFNVDTFSNLINKAIGNNEHIYIVDSNGTYINCFDENRTISKTKNLWEDLAECSIYDDSLEKIKERFHTKKQGGFFYEYNGEKRYGYHMPLGVQDWQLLLTVEEAEMRVHSEYVQKIAALNTGINILSLTVMLLSAYHYFRNVNRQIKNANQKVKKNNEIIKMAVEYSNFVIFEYNMIAKKIKLKTETPNLLFDKKEISNVPEYFAQLDTIEQNSICDIENLFKTIRTEKKSQADIQMKNDQNEKIWYRVSMNNIYNEKGDITDTVGSVTDITTLKEGEIAIERKKEMHEILITNALLYTRIDLNTASVVELNGNEVHIPYQKYFDKCLEQYVNEEYRSYVKKELSLENFNKTYEQCDGYKENQFVIEYNNEKKWVKCLVYRISKEETSEVVFVIKDIDEIKRKEIVLKTQAERDGLTGLYNATTARLKINKILENKHFIEEKQIFILFDLDNFKQINDTFGHAYGDQVLMDIANTLKNRFRSNDIIGRLGGDEFCIMLRGVRSEESIHILLNELKDSLTKTYVEEGVAIEVSASIGVAISPRDGTTVDELFKKADATLYKVKRSGKNGYYWSK